MNLFWQKTVEMSNLKEFPYQFKYLNVFLKQIKSVYYVSLGTFIVNALYPIYGYLMCAPALILKFQIWRMFTTQFCENFLGLIFGLLSLTFTAMMLERSIGTIPFIFDFMFKNFLIQLLHFIIILLLSLIFQTTTMVPSFGLFNIVILYMSLRCFSDPETSANFMCFPFQLKNKYQPFAILIFFSLLGGFRFDFFASIILGYIEVKYYGGMMLRLSQNRVNSLKNSFLFRKISTRGDFVDPNAPFLVQTASQPSQQQSTSSSTNVFSGRGVTIGASQPASQQQNRPNQQQYVINPSQQQHQGEQQGETDIKQFAGKGVSIGGNAGNSLSIQQQRELQLQRLQQQQLQEQNQSNDNKLEIETNADTSNDSNNPNTRSEQKNQQKKDGGYTALNEDLL